MSSIDHFTPNNIGFRNYLFLTSLLLVYPFVDLSRRFFYDTALLYISVDFIIFSFTVINFIKGISFRRYSDLFWPLITFFQLTAFSFLFFLTLQDNSTLLVRIVELRFFIIMTCAFWIGFSNRNFFYFLQNYYKKILKIIIIIAFFYSIWAILQIIFFDQLPISLKVIEEGTREVGSVTINLSSGPFFVPKRAGRYLMIMLIILFLLKSNIDKYKIFLFILIFMSGSREAIIMSSILFSIIFIKPRVMANSWPLILAIITIIIFINTYSNNFFLVPKVEWLTRANSFFNIFNALSGFYTPWGFGPEAYSQFSNVIQFDKEFDHKKFVYSNPFLMTVGDSYITKITIQSGMFGLIITLLFFSFMLIYSIYLFFVGRKVQSFSGLYLIFSLTKLHHISVDSFFVFILILIMSQKIKSKNIME